MLNLTRILPPRPGTYLFWYQPVLDVLSYARGDGGLATRERTTVPVDPEESFASIPVRVCALSQCFSSQSQGTSIPREWVTYCTVRLRRSEPKGDAPSVALLLLPVYYQARILAINALFRSQTRNQARFDWRRFCFIAIHR